MGSRALTRCLAGVRKVSHTGLHRIIRRSCPVSGQVVPGKWNLVEPPVQADGVFPVNSCGGCGDKATVTKKSMLTSRQFRSVRSCRLNLTAKQVKKCLRGIGKGCFMARIAGFLLTAAVGLISLAVTAHAAEPIGKVVAVGGSPTGSGRALIAGSPVYENDRLVTGKGNIQIIFIDDTKLVVGPNSSLVVDRFLLKGGKSAQKFSVNALRGTFRFITGDMAKKAYDIQTASATIGIRGTGFDFSSGRETLVAVLEGGVSLCASGQCAAIPDQCGVGRAGGN